MSMYNSNFRPYTVQISEMVLDPNFVIFDFDYELYDPSHKLEFEKKFCDHFMFYEIGTETIGRWKHMLRATLNDINRYYEQLYQTELASKDIQFMLNKDLKETFIRDIVGESEGNVSSADISNNTATNDNVNIFSDTPRGEIKNLEKYMTNASKDNGNTSVNSNSNTDSNSKSNTKNKETTEFISQGNIGVTSSATLLEHWRSILINIDQLIFEELEDLFFGLF